MSTNSSNAAGQSGEPNSSSPTAGESIFLSDDAPKTGIPPVAPAGIGRRIVKLVVSMVLIAIIVLGAFESYQYFQFARSLDRLDNEYMTRPPNRPLLMSEVPSLLSGFSREESTNPQQVVYVWRGIFSKRRVWITAFRRTQVGGVWREEPSPVVAQSGTRQPSGQRGASRQFSGRKGRGAAQAPVQPNRGRENPLAVKLGLKRTSPLGDSRSSDHALAFLESFKDGAPPLWGVRGTVGGSSGEDNVLVVDLYDIYASHGVLGGTLVREIGRQALLMSGREELGLKTRDRALREQELLTDDSVNWPLSILSHIDPSGETELSIVQRGETGWYVHWKKRIQVSRTEAYTDFVRQMEGLSRAEFPGILKRAGFTPVSAARKPNPELLKNALKQSENWNEVSQYFAVRSLHDAIRTTGETPELLGNLARVYANLGSLTQYYWTAGPKAFQARALLYAERAVAATKQSPAALWDRAYVRALVGLHGAALQDLEAADRLRKDAKEAAEPDWVPALRAFVSGDEEGLEKAASSGPQRRLARYLVLLTIERTSYATAIREAARRMLYADPDCFRAIEVLANTSGLSGTGWVAIESDQRFIEHVYDRLNTADELPASIHAKVAEIKKIIAGGVAPPAAKGGLVEWLRRRVGGAPAPAAPGVASGSDRAHRLQLIREIAQKGQPAADAGEPSLATLSYLLHEVTFVNSWRSIDFPVHHLGVPAETLVADWLPVLDGHPLRDFIAAHTRDQEQGQELVAKYLTTMSWRDLETASTPVLTQIATFQPDQYEQAWDRFDNRLDHTYYDVMSLFSYQTNAAEVPSWAQHNLSLLRQTCPVALGTILKRIEFDPGGSAIELAGWAAKYPRNVSLQGQLGEAYRVLSRFEEAEQCLLRAVAVDPTFETWHDLALVYESLGDDAKWLQTLETAAKYKGEGLAPFDIQAEIAQHHMAHNDPDAALPFALRAASSYAYRHLALAAGVHERLGNWNKAEEYFQAASERYDGSSRAQWLAFCLRTGHGNRRRAQATAEQYLSTFNQKLQPGQWTDGLAITLAAGNTSRALDIAKQEFDTNETLFPGWILVVLAEKAGDRPLREKTLRKMISNGELDHENYQSGSVEFLKRIEIDFKHPGTPSLDLPAMEELVNSLAEFDIPRHWYFLGSYLTARGDATGARKYMEWCVSSPSKLYDNALSQQLAGAWLQDAGFEVPADRRELVVKLNLKPTLPGSRVLNEPKSPVSCVEFTANQQLAAGSNDGVLRVWNLDKDSATAKETAVGDSDSMKPAASWIVMSPTGNVVAVAKPHTAQVTLLNLSDETRKTLPGHGSVAQFGVISPDGKTLAVYYVERLQGFDLRGDITLWDVATGKETKRLPAPKLALKSLAFFPTGQELLATASADPVEKNGLLLRWSLTEPKPRTVAQERRGFYGDCAISRDGRRYATCADEHRLQIRDAQNDQILATSFQSKSVTSLALSPAGNLLAIGADDGSIRLWNFAADRVERVLRGHLRRVATLSFSPDGHHLASGSDDLSVRTWDLRSPATSDVETTRPVNVVTNSIGMRFVPIAAGEFTMGHYSPPYRLQFGDHRLLPRRRVRISHDFYFGQHEVTVAHFREFVKATGYKTAVELARGGRNILDDTDRGGAGPVKTQIWSNPGFPQGDDHPVGHIAFKDALAFCEWLGRKEQTEYRLPTEAEWEYACRAGTVDECFFGPLGTDIEDYANCGDATLHAKYPRLGKDTVANDGFVYSSPVGSFAPNPFGLYDILGNMSEWVSDWYTEKFYLNAPAVDPPGPKTGDRHLIRGGAFPFYHSLTCAGRDIDGISQKEIETYSSFGFRVLRVIKPTPKP